MQKNTEKTRDKELLLWFYRARVNIGNCDHFYKNWIIFNFQFSFNCFNKKSRSLVKERSVPLKSGEEGKSNKDKQERE